MGGDSLWSTLGELAGAVGNEVASCIPGADMGQGSSPGDSTPSVGSGTNYDPDGSYSGSSSSDGQVSTTRDHRGNISWHSERAGNGVTHHYKGGKGLLSVPEQYSIDRGNGVEDFYRYSDNTPLSRSIRQGDGHIDYYDANGDHIGSTRKR